MNKYSLSQLAGSIPPWQTFQLSAKKSVVLLTRMLAVILLGVLISSCGVVVVTGSSSSTPTPVATENSTPALPPSSTPAPAQTGIQSTNLGYWNYPHTDGPYPQPSANGAIVAQGDIQNDGQCHIKIFYSGDTVANLGSGGFQLIQLTGGGGDRNAIVQYVTSNIQPGLQSAHGSCPII